MNSLQNQLHLKQIELQNHKVYKLLNNKDNLACFMESHVFAVWDFMSLLKSLQREITCVTVPWTPSKYSKEIVRMVNEIVLGEESDVDETGSACDHFTLYLEAMNEVGASTQEINDFLKELKLDNLEDSIREFVQFNLELALGDEPHKTASAFFFGREKLIPDMFTGILTHVQDCPKLTYYLDRHIELDGDEHSILAKKCLDILCEGSTSKMNEALEIGLKALELRVKLWDSVFNKIEAKSSIEVRC